MPNLSEESLFSLELVVDKLTIPKIPCRFPAIAFRLLDFPTLVIYHVEPELGDAIKTKIKSDPHYKLGGQIPELLDKNGSFCVRKGKSCLLKISPDMLLSHLTSTPLYVMIIDTFPEVPKLIGNCTVPLDSTMDVLYDEVCKQGLAVPVVHGEKGVYKIYNLMGTQIGGLELGIRLLSLGVGLIPHLPAASISKLSKGKVTTPNKKVKDRIQEKVADIVLEEFEAARQKPTLESAPLSNVNKTKNVFENFQVQTQTEEEIVQNMATQTEKRKAKFPPKKQSRSVNQGDIDLALGQDMVDDIVVTNTICPPPLYFNSDNDSKGIEIFKKIMSEKQEEQDVESASLFSESDTIRKEDWASDSDVDYESTPFDKPSSKKVHKPYSKPMQGNKHAPNIKGFPLLNALMTEIVSLQNGGQVGNVQSDEHISIFHPSRHPKRRERSPSPSGHPSYSRSPSPGRERESVDKHLLRMSTPRHADMVRELPSPKITHKVLPIPDKPLKMHKCQKAQKGVPKGQSWIRKVPPPLGVQKTKLMSGLTNTQRLRLEKTNPDLLKRLEKEEKERVRLFKEQEDKRKAELEASGTLGSTAAVQYGIDGHRIEGTYRPHSEAHRRPVPTPRQNSNLGTEEMVREYRDQHSVTPEDDPYMLDDNEDHYSGDTISADSRDRSDNGHTSAHYEYEESDVEPNARSNYNTKGRIGGTQKFIAGVPVPPSTNNKKDQDIAEDEYSDNFESARPTQRTDTEVEVQDQSSAENGNDEAMAMDAGEGLGLRMIVDKYSDDENDSQPSQASFKSAVSNLSNVSRERIQVQQGAQPRVNFARGVEGPKASSHAPAVRSGHGHHRGRTGESAATTSVDSTAYISRSQVLSQQSYESNLSNDPNNGEANNYLTKRGANNGESHARIRPSPRPRRNTESVSSYNGEDWENMSPRSGISQSSRGERGGNQSESVEEYSDADLPVTKSMDQARVDPQAKMGYTWGY